MRRKPSKLNSEKMFWAGILLILTAYSFLGLAQSCCVHITGEVMLGVTRESCVPIFTVPFPSYSSQYSFGWCFIMEWSVPLLLCLAYAMAATGQKRIYILITGIVAAGIGKIYVSRQLISDPGYWLGASQRIGKLLPMFFLIWLFAALLLMLTAPKFLQRFGRNRKAKTGCLLLVCLFSLSEGIMFNVVYFGQYTLFYTVRSLLILFLVLLTIRYLDRGDAMQPNVAEGVEQGDESHHGKETAKCMKILKIGMGLCFLAYLLVVSVVILCWINQSDAWSFPYPLIENYLYRHYSVFLAIAASIHSMRVKKGYSATGVLAVFCGIAFWIQGFFLNRFVQWPLSIWGTTTSLTAWVIIMFLLLTWLWKESKWIKILFNVILYLIVIGSKCMEQFMMQTENTSCFVIYIILSIIMGGITLFALAKTEKTEIKSMLGKKGLFIWLSLLSYALLAFLDYEIRFAKGRFSVIQGLASDEPISGTNVIYVFAFLILLSFLAHAMKKKEMQLFCSLAAMTAVCYIEDRGFRGILVLNQRPSASIAILLIILLLFFPFLTKLFPKREHVLGGTFLLITYVVLFLNFVLPLLTYDLSRYRWAWYGMTQVILLGITVLTFVLYGKK